MRVQLSSIKSEISDLQKCIIMPIFSQNFSLFQKVIIFCKKIILTYVFIIVTFKWVYKYIFLNYAVLISSTIKIPR